MTDFRSTLGRRWAVAAFFLFAAVYYALLPSTVQTNDTGELVANAFGLHIIHPPGYPAYLWLYHGFLKIFPEGTPFFRAALLTSWLGAATVAILALLPSMRTSMGFLLLAGLATSKIFMQYSVLPDVFMLHLLLCAGILAAYLGAWGLRRKLFVLALLLGLGTANHLTIIFLSPLYFLTAWQNRSLRDAALSAALGAVLALLLYGSLMGVSTGHILDWKVLAGAGDLANHFLRVDYGTFRLSGGFEKPGYLSLLYLFLKTLNQGIPILLFGAIAGTVLCAGRWRTAKGLSPGAPEFRFLTIAAILILYVIAFLPLCNLPTRGFFVELLERFFLMPSVLIAVLGVLGLQMLWPKLRPSIRVMVALAAVISLLFNIAQRDRADYSRDTLVEDYVMDLLNRAASRSNSVLLANTDTVFFAAGYVQYALGFQPQVPVLFLGGAGRAHLTEATRHLVPALKYELVRGSTNDIEAKFVADNFGRVAIFSMLPVQAGGAALRMHRVGYEVVAKADPQPYFDNMETTQRTDTAVLREFGGRVSLRMYDLRCAYELVQADWKYKNKDFSGALTTLDEATIQYPTCFPAFERRCQLLAEQPELGDVAACEAGYENQQSLYRDDYLEFTGAR